MASSGKSTYWANALLDLLLSGAAFSAPGTTYAALYSVMPTATAGSGTEATGGSYARVAITSNTTNFPLASGGVKSNGTTITFPTATGSWSSGANMVGATLMDASSSGNELYFGALTNPQAVASSNVVIFAIGQFSISET